MPEFMLIMRGERAQDPSPQEMQQRMQEYMAWMHQMTAEGRLKAGQPLEPRGAWLTDADTVITDGPFLEAREIIGGYVILAARDLDEAVALAQGCPLLQHCEIYVRPVLDVPT
ncbi:MAG: hypothetical protein H6739_13810 [Alphaproteobacteria bacterium]|nr:hypothetical protein [Alphaproteobacteria bacterium]